MKKLDEIRRTALSYLGKDIEITIDRPLGSAHPKHPDMIYPINYGYISGTVGGDGEEIDAYLLGVDAPVRSYRARVIGVVCREDDDEDKLIAAPSGISFTADEMYSAVEFQEKYFDSHIEVKTMNETQIIFDDETFFEGYKKIRENPECANETEEKPALFSLAPDLCGKAVLDLGCGFGENCAEFQRLGASSVMGVDISRRMLDGADVRCPGIEFVCADMNDLGFLGDRRFDAVFSSLAIHYVKDFNKLARQVYEHMNDGGVFIFSQEHPLTTAPMGGVSWEKADDGTKLHYNLTDYSASGQRIVSWMVDGIVKYHRTFSDIVNALIGAGFTVERMLEPSPDAEFLKKYPQYAHNVHKPNFLLVRCRK